ncbi:MAG: hypothetical protein EOM90_14980 [Alphaproteobacteria bacterium]|nr:hypothetical protein [Alphaproteobacteria bacterium]
MDISLRYLISCQAIQPENPKSDLPVASSPSAMGVKLEIFGDGAARHSEEYMTEKSLKSRIDE